jgi:hypothetical protein
MRNGLIVGLALLLNVGSGLAQQSSDSGFWKGKFEVYQFNFSYGTAHDYAQNREFIHRGVDLWKEEYDLYQNPTGIARQELTHMNRNRSVEGPLDVRLLDYSRGYGLVFDKGGGRAIEGPLEPTVAGRDLGSRRILGFACRGRQYEWTTFQQVKVQLQSWSAHGSNLRVPLLQVENITDSTGALVTLRIRVVSNLEPVPYLPASLFEQPAGLQVTKVPSIQ